MTRPSPFEELEKSPLKSLNGTRDKFLANFDGANLTEVEQQEVAHFLTWLDCVSVYYAADIACGEHQTSRERNPDRSNMLGSVEQVNHESRKQRMINELYHVQFKIYLELVKN